MLLRPGHWLGRGTLLIEGQSLGQGVTCDAEISHEDDGYRIAAEVDIKEIGSRALSIRVAANEVGTYSVNLRTVVESLSGTAKLDSPPNLGLLWNEAADVHVTFALFAVSGGYGCRGFLRAASTTYTWEMALSLKQEALGGDNVVSLANRRRR